MGFVLAYATGSDLHATQPRAAVPQFCFACNTAEGGCATKLMPGFTALDFVEDPAVGLFEAVFEAGVGFPAEAFLDEGVVGVAAVDAFGGGEVVVAFEGDAG